jgi:hypothetical protein
LAGSESDPKAIHLQVEAPLVFRAADLPPAPISEMHGLPADSRQLAAPAISDPLPPMPPQTPQPSAAPPDKTDPAPRRGFFGKVRGFFSAMFH